MPAKMSEHATFRIQAQKLANHFYRKYFAMPQGRMWPPFPQPLSHQKIFDQAKYCYHERGNIHFGDLRTFVFVCSFTNTAVSFLCQDPKLTCTSG
jgi:hypothetical protein